MKLAYFILLSCFSLTLYANEEKDRQEIQLRIQPVGQVFIKNEVNSTEVALKKESGKETYEQYCTVCHRDGLAGAPRFRNKKDWKSRLNGKTLDALVASSIKGLNAMPSKGTCIKCNEQDLKAAIKYMLPRS